MDRIYSARGRCRRKEAGLVTKTGKAYHSSRECAYLDLSIRTVNQKEVTSLRNKSGSRYMRCGSCCKNKKEKVCYITDYGPAIIWIWNVRGLKRTVYVISLDRLANASHVKSVHNNIYRMSNAGGGEKC